MTAGIIFLSLSKQNSNHNFQGSGQHSKKQIRSNENLEQIQLFALDFGGDRYLITTNNERKFLWRKNKFCYCHLGMKLAKAD